MSYRKDKRRFFKAGWEAALKHLNENGSVPQAETKEFNAAFNTAVTKPWGPKLYQVGDQVGEWTLLKYIGGQKNPRVAARWQVKCSCGVERTVQASNLTSGTSRSCGHDRGKRKSWLFKEVEE